MSLVGTLKVQDCKVRKSWSKMTYGPLKQSGGGNLVHKSAARGGIGKTPPGIRCCPGLQLKEGLKGVIWAISGAARVGNAFLTFSIEVDDLEFC